MAGNKLKSIIQLRRDTAPNLASKNPILRAGEPCLETDTGLIKIGDGITPWRDLPYKQTSGNGGLKKLNATKVLYPAQTWFRMANQSGYYTGATVDNNPDIKTGDSVLLVGSVSDILDSLGLPVDVILFGIVTSRMDGDIITSNYGVIISNTESSGTDGLFEKKHIYKTSSEFTSENPTLGKNIIGKETNTGRQKVGDGVTAWNDLPYDVRVGGRNLLLNSNVRYENQYFAVATYYFGKDKPRVGDECTITIKGDLKGLFTRLFITGSEPVLCILEDRGNGLYQGTFNWANFDADVHNQVVVIVGTAGDGITKIIEWVKLEYGNTPTDWTPAPEDKLDAPTTAGTVGQVLTLGANKNPIWANVAGGGGNIIPGIPAFNAAISQQFVLIMTDADGKLLDSSSLPVEIGCSAYFGEQQVTGDTLWMVNAENVVGEWDRSRKVYTVTGLSDKDLGWVYFDASYNGTVIRNVLTVARIRQGSSGTGTGGEWYKIALRLKNGDNVLNGRTDNTLGDATLSVNFSADTYDDRLKSDDYILGVLRWGKTKCADMERRGESRKSKKWVLSFFHGDSKISGGLSELKAYITGKYTDTNLRISSIAKKRTINIENRNLYKDSLYYGSAHSRNFHIGVAVFKRIQKNNKSYWQRVSNIACVTVRYIHYKQKAPYIYYDLRYSENG